MTKWGYCNPPLHPQLGEYDEESAHDSGRHRPGQPGRGQLIITGVFDGPLSGGLPKGVEMFACDDIADLSIYGLGSANNGGGTDGVEWTFPAVSMTAGTTFYVSGHR